MTSILLVDVSLPHKKGFSPVQEPKKGDPDLPCVMLSGHASRHSARNSLAVGARGYLVKEDAAEVLKGIRCILQGEVTSVKKQAEERWMKE